MPILDQLEKEYSVSSKDWCQVRNGEDAKDRAHHMSSLLSKHMEYKERFLKVCLYFHFINYVIWKSKLHPTFEINMFLFSILIMLYHTQKISCNCQKKTF